MHLLWPKTTESIATSSGDVDVWAVAISTMLPRWDELWELLSPSERQRAEQYKVDAPRRQFVVTRAVLRMLLARHLARPAADIEFAVGAQGKPQLAGELSASDVRFNVAHSDELALVAITTGCEIGVDVERLRRVEHMEQIAAKYFHPKEAESILQTAIAERDAAFLRCWTGKEAVLKAAGSGVTGALDALRVPTEDHEGSWVELPATEHGTAVRCWLHPLAPERDYVAAIACTQEQRPIRCFAFSR